MALLLESPPLPVGRLGMVARWKPVHLGHAAVLHALCRNSERAIIGIGSSNKYNARNPFTVAETAEMIHLVLDGYTNYQLFEVPDLGNGPRWQAMVRDAFGDLDLYLTANKWVADLLSPHWDVMHPVHLVPIEHRVPLTGTMVREAIARGEDWEEMVPPPVASYLKDRGLIRRFRDEFGLAVLASPSV